MDEVVITDNEYITIKHIPEKGLIYHTVHQNISGETLREALLKGTAAMAAHEATCKWLSDDRKNGPLPPDDVKWGEEIWNAKTMAAGWKYWALVVPTEIVSAGAMAPVINNMFELGLRMMVFDNVEAALKWLDEME